MLRKTFVIIPIILLALTGCSNNAKDTAAPSAQGPTIGAPAAQGAATTAPATPQACPTARTRKFAKTRFITSAGLAAGAFKRYIYSPLKKGSFKSGAPGQKKAVVKAAAAGLFALDQIRRAKANAQADPSLCKVVIAPLTNLSTAMKNMVGKLRRGDADPAMINGTSGALEHARGSAGSAGAGFKDKEVPSNMIGG